MMTLNQNEKQAAKESDFIAIWDADDGGVRVWHVSFAQDDGCPDQFNLMLYRFENMHSAFDFAFDLQQETGLDVEVF